MSKVGFTSLALLIATTVGALAGTPSRAAIDAREQRQLGSIEQGRQDGSITWREGLHLRAEERRIAHTESALAADGHLSKADRRYVDTLQDRAHADIVAEKNDGWHRLWWLPRFGR